MKKSSTWTEIRRNNVQYFYSALMAKTGTIRFTVKRLHWYTGWQTMGSWDVPQGWYRSYFFISGTSNDPDIKSIPSNSWGGYASLNVFGWQEYSIAAHGLD